MFDNLAGSVLQSGLTPVLFLVCTLASLLLGLGTAFIYMRRSTYSKSFVITLALLPAMVQLVIIARPTETSGPAWRGGSL